jgi:hypothetical protein
LFSLQGLHLESFARAFDVSEDAIRRDLKLLKAMGYNSRAPDAGHADIFVALLRLRRTGVQADVC